MPRYKSNVTLGRRIARVYPRWSRVDVPRERPCSRGDWLEGLAAGRSRSEPGKPLCDPSRTKRAEPGAPAVRTEWRARTERALARDKCTGNCIRQWLSAAIRANVGRQLRRLVRWTSRVESSRIESPGRRTCVIVSCRTCRRREFVGNSSRPPTYVVAFVCHLPPSFPPEQPKLRAGITGDVR